jgi:hypothetical protein
MLGARQRHQNAFLHRPRHVMRFPLWTSSAALSRSAFPPVPGTEDDQRRTAGNFVNFGRIFV